VEIHTFGRPDKFAEVDSLNAVEAAVKESGTDWAIFHAADEIYCSNRSGETYREALERIAADGFNAIDHESQLYPPIDETFEPGIDHEAHFRYWEDDGIRKKMRLRQIRAWKNHPGMRFIHNGHCVALPERNVPDERLIRKHYPIRSSAHGVKKMFGERHGRGEGFSFVQYKYWHPGYEKSKNFLRDPKDLNYDEMPS